jgi:hypothetical protein
MVLERGTLRGSLLEVLHLLSSALGDLRDDSAKQ